MAQQLEKLVQEDLNAGTGVVWIAAANGGELRSTQIGAHTFAVGQIEHTATWAPGAIAAGSKASTTVTVSGAAVGDFAWASHDKILTSDLRISAHISAANTVDVVIHNPTASSVTVASGTVGVLVFNVLAPQSVLPEDGTIFLVQWIDDRPTNLLVRVWMTDPSDADLAGYYFWLSGGTPAIGETYKAKSGTGTTYCDLAFTPPTFPDPATDYTVNVQSANAYGVRSLNVVTDTTSSP